jgi:hypothetical protein
MKVISLDKLGHSSGKPEDVSSTSVETWNVPLTAFIKTNIAEK